ncbi:DDE-type integrase/transposase/recombinase [Litorivicinus sp.]|nr:DDE-type integrase/transposase/recombinase [Litorivicinus sp.]
MTLSKKSLVPLAAAERSIRVADFRDGQPNQVWATGTTYISIAPRRVYLLVVMDWDLRRALSWRVSSTLDTRLCVEALEEAFQPYVCSEIFDTDQGSQFGNTDFKPVLKTNNIRSVWMAKVGGSIKWLLSAFEAE